MATKKATETTEKTAGVKSSPAKVAPASAKAMDIHPVGTAPTVTTGRPVIVGNKSMANDPMLSINKPRANKDVAPDENAAGDATTAPVISRHAKTISPLTAADVEEPLEQENDAVAKSVEAITAPKAAEDENVASEDTKNVEPDTSETSEAASDKTEEPASEPEPAKTEAEPKEKLGEPTVVEETTDVESADATNPPPEEETVLQEKTAEQMREDQLEEFIQKKTYAVPIDKTGRRRHNAMLALLLVLVAVVVTLNFLLDFGVITIPGAPSTDLFSPKAL